MFNLLKSTEKILCVLKSSVYPRSKTLKLHARIVFAKRVPVKETKQRKEGVQSDFPLRAQQITFEGMYLRTLWYLKYDWQIQEAIICSLNCYFSDYLQFSAKMTWK